MSFRGRGRGRGRFGGGRGGFGFGFARQEPFVEFPEVELPDRKAVKEERVLVVGNAKLVAFWKSSPYYLEETISKKSQSMDVERFSDWGKSKTSLKRDALGNFLQLRSSNFPKELIAGAKWERPNPKKVRWDPNSDLQKWDLFEKLEQKHQGREEKGQKENKEGEDEEEDDDEEAEEAEEDFSDDDYNQNVDFDDDDDDYNDMDDGDNDEPEY
ncbi:DNA-directed RNA polymerase III subunit RPC7 [Ricinus communis]|nr:DNA-directed RNA polymerase III subunit RPC7 [Ricinus communis]XP_015572823.1 DNA-directed RNA polymerase III subunit RPC7 [Ricinus communis]XP_015572824.1 DNA-directed RNA polymerase III subunit RPC7 [Ricinus communis]XP_025012563.1 DNA-directed RNA polymerase III subunit RPC7 [Ricinus communis]|eukprot:XP_015572822.1 DNA-directed RNA polymerase III subunit RPC7 [Ricinus communis]